MLIAATAALSVKALPAEDIITIPDIVMKKKMKSPSFTSSEQQQSRLPSSQTLSTPSIPLSFNEPLAGVGVEVSVSGDVIQQAVTKGWSVSANLNVLFAALFITVLVVQWVHNRSLSSQMNDIRSDLLTHQRLLEQSLQHSQQVIQELLHREL